MIAEVLGEIFLEPVQLKIVKDDFNELTNTGARLALKVDLNDNWSVLASVMTQEMETEGIWAHDPENPNGEIGDMEVQRFNEDSMNDEFEPDNSME